MRVFDWLLLHGEKILPPAEWENLLGVDIIDRDGWRDDDTPWTLPLSLREFMVRANSSTLS